MAALLTLGVDARRAAPKELGTLMREP